MKDTVLVIPVELLNVCLEVARLGSYSEVGKKRGCAARAVSDCMSQLERLLGFQVVQSDTRTFRLNEVGERFFDYVEAALKKKKWHPGEACPLSVKNINACKGEKPTVAKKGALPDGDLFMIFDQRPESSVRGIYDLDPSETEAISARRAVYYKNLKPDTPADRFHTRSHLVFPMTPDLVKKRSGVKRAIPNKIPHLWTFCIDWASMNDGCYSYYRFVSPEWKAAIEGIEPGVHEFFAHEVVFSDGVWPCFVFRNRQLLELKVEGPTSGTMDRFRGSVRRKLIAGHHWIQPERWNAECVSRELALRLLPLMAREMSFVPVKLTD